MKLDAPLAVQREPRLVVTWPVTLDLDGEHVGATTQDVSKKGVFVRTDRIAAVGAAVGVTLEVSPARPLGLQTTVVHVLAPEAAKALGREPGMGLAFVEDDPARAELEAALEELEPVLSMRPEGPRATRILVADASTPLLERLSSALGHAGFVVVTATNGAEAYSSMMDEPPDLVLSGIDMAVVDGWRLLAMMGARADLARIPFAMMSDQADDVTRLKAYRMGVMDFVPKPFTVAELCIRMRRLARANRHRGQEVVVRGDLAQIGVASLLSLLEFERKSGVLTLVRETEVAWLSVDGGRVVKVETSEDVESALAIVMNVLDWDRGEFEFLACAVFEADDLGMSTTQLLLEHGRRRDEEGARSA